MHGHLDKLKDMIKINSRPLAARNFEIKHFNDHLEPLKSKWTPAKNEGQFFITCRNIDQRALSRNSLS